MIVRIFGEHDIFAVNAKTTKVYLSVFVFYYFDVSFCLYSVYGQVPKEMRGTQPKRYWDVSPSKPMVIKPTKSDLEKIRLKEIYPPINIWVQFSL